MSPTERLARIGYEAYGRSTGFKNFQGNPMPAWENLTIEIQAAWRANAAAIATSVMAVALGIDEEL